MSDIFNGTPTQLRARAERLVYHADCPAFDRTDGLALATWQASMAVALWHLANERERALT